MTEVQGKIWKEMLDSEMNSQYFETLAGRYAWRDRWTKIFLALTSSGSAFAGWTIWHDPSQHPYFTAAWKVTSSLATVIAIVSPFLNFSKKVEWATLLRIAYQSSAQDYDLLWVQRDKVDEANY